ncbi:MAG: hypothetical protein OHK0010_33640 [Anaerolineales bacterium]
MPPKTTIPLLLLLLAFLLTACKFIEVVESLPPIPPTASASPAAPTASPAPTATPTAIPTATLFRGVQNPQNGHWYLLRSEARSWHTAQEYCRGMGAYLVTISGEAENRFVYAISSSTWLGASDEKEEGVWSWVTGEPMTYANWAEGEPNNCGEPDCRPEHFLTFSETPRQWNDVPALELPFICEWDR